MLFFPKTKNILFGCFSEGRYSNYYVYEPEGFVGYGQEPILELPLFGIITLYSCGDKGVQAVTLRCQSLHPVDYRSAWANMVIEVIAMCAGSENYMDRVFGSFVGNNIRVSIEVAIWPHTNLL